jgi:hypothetical protein
MLIYAFKLDGHFIATFVQEFSVLWFYEMHFAKYKKMSSPKFSTWNTEVHLTLMFQKYY